MTAVISLATFLAMFMDDCRLAFLPPPNDVSCQIVSLGILVRLPAAQHLLNVTSTPTATHMQPVALSRLVLPQHLQADVHTARTSGRVLRQSWACHQQWLRLTQAVCSFTSEDCVQVIFFVETVSGSMLRSGYFLRLYFWIDALATVCPVCLLSTGPSMVSCCRADPLPPPCLRLRLCSTVLAPGQLLLPVPASWTAPPGPHTACSAAPRS